MISQVNSCGVETNFKPPFSGGDSRWGPGSKTTETNAAKYGGSSSSIVCDIHNHDVPALPKEAVGTNNLFQRLGQVGNENA